MLKLNNKAEREQFLKNYKEWERISNCVPELGLEFYRYLFANGAYVIVTEYYRVGYNGERVAHKYCLVLPDGDTYNPYDQNSGHSKYDFMTYTLEGCGMSIIVDYMTKRRDEI